MHERKPRADPPRPAPPRVLGLGAAVHAVYVAAIVVLLVVLVAVAAKMSRACDFVRRVKSRYGLDDDVAATTPRPGALRCLTPEKLLAPRTFDQYRAEFDGIVRRAFELGDFDDRRNLPVTAERDALGDSAATLQNACFSALKGGKRLRPIILMEVARATSKARFDASRATPVDPADVALSLECFHAASLVIDDMPLFDNDAVRRGEPSLWAATSQGTALMAAVAIMASAFQNVCHQVDWIRNNCPADYRTIANVDRIGTIMCSQLSTALGVVGTASGQFMDSMPPADLARFVGSCAPAAGDAGDGDAGDADAGDGDAGDADAGDAGAAGAGDAGDAAAVEVRSAVQTLVQRKTSPFYEAAFVCGWLVGGGDPSDHAVDEIRQAGRDFGVAFQVADDIGDLEQDRERRKSGRGGWNYADVYGAQAAERELARRLNSCRATLRSRGLYTPLWDEIYGKVAKMAVP